MILEHAAALVAALPQSPSSPMQVLVLATALAEYRRRRSSSVRRAEQGRAAFYDGAWRDAASRLGATVRILHDNMLEIGIEDVRTRVSQNETAADDIVTLRLAGDKLAVHRLVRPAGVPMPEYLSFTVDKWEPALTFLSRAEGSCVVKPTRSGAAGHGVTTGVDDRRGLVFAIARAAIFGRDLIIEREVQGCEYRLLFLDGVLLDAYERRPPTLQGDGKATIAELVRRENRQRLARGARYAQTLLNIDADMLLTLRAAGLSLRSVLPKNQIVVAKKVVNENAAIDNEEVTGRLAESIVESARSAAAAVGIRLAGVDIITPDPGSSLEEAGGVVLEVNSTPGLYNHYNRIGEPAAVAVPILAALLSKRPSGSGGSALGQMPLDQLASARGVKSLGRHSSGSAVS